MTKSSSTTERIAIAGVPSSGKTTLAEALSPIAWHTDDLIDLGWSEASEHASYWFDDTAATIIEGVSVPRALRKWLKRNPTGKPADRVIFLCGPHTPLTKGQLSMAKGCWTVWQEIRPELVERGVEIEEKGELPWN